LSKPAIVLFGDSHSYAIQRAIEKRRAKGRPVPLAAHRLLKVKGTKQIGDTSFEDFLDVVRPLQPHDVVLSMIGGNQYAVFSMIQHPQRFDFIEPEDDKGLDPGAEIIPYRLLADAFRQGIRGGDGKSLAALRKATAARVVHVIPPPPKADNDFIQQHHETVFAKEGIASQGVSSAALRMKFWHLQTRVLAEICAELGVEIMMPPSAACDPEGFLIRDCYASDATHANDDYGELILRQVERDYASPVAELQSAP